MTVDFTTRRGATVARATRIQPGRCAQCRCEIVGGRKRHYCTVSCRKDARADRARNHVRTAEEIEYARKYQLAYRHTVTGRRASLRSRRKGRIDGTQGYRTRVVYFKASRRTYRQRRKKMLAQARERAKYAHRQPTCATCGVEVAYANSGRPRKRCPLHHRGRGIRR